MKHSILTTLLLLFALSAAAQPPRPMGGGGERRGDGIHAMQCDQIVNVLRLEEAKQAEFKEIYMAYNRAVQELHAPRERGGGMRPDMTQQSEEQIEARTLDSFDRSIKSMELKREYYKKFRTILQPSEITRMYNIERKIRDRAIEEMMQRNHNRGGGEMRGE